MPTCVWIWCLTFDQGNAHNSRSQYFERVTLYWRHRYKSKNHKDIVHCDCEIAVASQYWLILKWASSRTSNRVYSVNRQSGVPTIHSIGKFATGTSAYQLIHSGQQEQQNVTRRWKLSLSNPISTNWSGKRCPCPSNNHIRRQTKGRNIISCNQIPISNHESGGKPFCSLSCRPCRCQRSPVQAWISTCQNTK